MRSFRLHKAVFGRVVSLRNSGSSALLETDDLDVPYLALGSEVHPLGPGFLLSRRPDLKEGDVVRVGADGQIRHFYRADSNDNSLFLTASCNQHCSFCPQPPHNDRSRISDCLRVIRLIKPSPADLGITGGEPTVVFNDLIALLHEIREIHPETWCQVLTNATALADSKKASLLASTFDGPGVFCIPLYSDDERIHDNLVGHSGSFWKAISGIYGLAKGNVQIEIRTVILQQNYKRLFRFIDWIYNTFPFACHVALMGYEPVGLGALNLNKHWVNPADYSLQLEKSVLSLAMRGVQVSIFNHPLCMLPPSVRQFSAKSISDWKRLYIDLCDNCDEKHNCGGMFISARRMLDSHIHPICK